MAQQISRIGLIGYGQIGQTIYQKIQENPRTGMRVVFVHDQVMELLGDLPRELILEDLAGFASREADLIVEMAHPDVTRQWGTRFLQQTHYMLVSVTALADRFIEEALQQTAREHGTRAYIPHGGVVGMDALLENRTIWEEVHVTMKKHPDNIDFARTDLDPAQITRETVIYDGPTRGVCPLFPRNVNTHAAIAYAGIGFDRTRSTLIVNPAWNTATVAIHARGPGVELQVERVEAISGVTGASTPASIYNSIQMIASGDPGIHLR